MDPRDPQRLTMSELARAIGAAPEPTAMYTAISEAAVRVLGATVARLWVKDPASGLPRAGGSFGALLDAVEVPLGAGLPGRGAVARVPEFIADAREPGLPPMLDIWRSGRD